MRDIQCERDRERERESREHERQRRERMIDKIKTIKEGNERSEIHKDEEKTKNQKEKKIGCD